MRVSGGLLVVIVTSALVTSGLIPLVIGLARRWGAVVNPGDRRIHTQPTPTLGGLAMFGGLLAGFGAAALTGDFAEVFSTRSAVVGVALASTVMLACGAIDDLREVSAPAKLAGMILAGSVLTVAGVTIVNVPIPFVGFTVLAPDLAVVASVVWVVLMANAVNLVDGLDGLAAGIVAIAAAAFLVYTLRLEQLGSIDSGTIGPLVAAATVGMCLGFLPWNFHPARIFMGDSGALMLGLLLAASTIAVGGQSDESQTGNSWFFFAPLVIPLVILGVPLVDMAFAILRRATRRTGLATADKDHLHHRLLRLGHGHRRSVLILWGFSALLSAFALVPVVTRRGEGLWPIAIIALALLLFTMLMPRVDRRRGLAEPEETVESSNGEAAEESESPTPLHTDAALP